MSRLIWECIHLFIYEIFVAKEQVFADNVSKICFRTETLRILLIQKLIELSFADHEILFISLYSTDMIFAINEIRALTHAFSSFFVLLAVQVISTLLNHCLMISKLIIRMIVIVVDIVSHCLIYQCMKNLCFEYLSIELRKLRHLSHRSVKLKRCIRLKSLERRLVHWWSFFMLSLE